MVGRYSHDGAGTPRLAWTRRRTRSRGKAGFGLVEVLVSAAVLMVCLVGLCGAMASVLAMEIRLREESLERTRLWAEAERIRSGDEAAGPGGRIVVHPEMRPLREYRLSTSRGTEWRVWREH